MILILTGRFEEQVATLLPRLTEAGFRHLDIEELLPLPEPLRRQIPAAWGTGFRAHLLARHIDSLFNHVVTSAWQVEELVELNRYHPVAVLDPLGRLGPGQRKVLAQHAIPVQELAEPDGLVHALGELSGALKRVSWDDYFMAIAAMVAQRSDCVKRRVATVIVKDRRIVATGYNGTPRGTVNCSKGGCPRCSQFAASGTLLGECLCSHGEENAITQAAYHGISVRGATLYSTTSPCVLCTKMIINSGLAKVVYNAAYPLGERSLELLQEAGVGVRQYAGQPYP